MTSAITFQNISKQYRLGLVSTRTLSHDLNRWWKVNVMRKDDPYLKIGETNDRATKGESEYVWALKDINFEVQQGEVLGIIGKNGAGKSTLLKILSRVTTPTTGIIKAHGRIASLLEVGTGFHPEMTGRENIYMNGCIMGMSKAEINRKFDEIVDFAGVERYIDTPTKRYSSGMTVRLGFAVAAFLEPEILVVDEVLAVGDAEFQKKAIGKMQDVSKNEGRTVLFVSHNMAAVSRLCQAGILLNNGQIQFYGDIEETIQGYLKGGNQQSALFKNSNNKDIEIQIISAELQDEKGDNKVRFGHKEDVYIYIEIDKKINRKSVRCNIALRDLSDQLIFIDRVELPEAADRIMLKGRLNGNLLLANRFKINISIDIPKIKVYDIQYSCLSFDIIDQGAGVSINGDKENGIIMSLFTWQIR